MLRLACLIPYERKRAKIVTRDPTNTADGYP